LKVLQAAKIFRCARVFFAAMLVAVVCSGIACLLLPARAVAAAPDEPPSDSIGSIEGDAISVQGPMTVQVVNGVVKTIVRSGSDIRVKTGRAQINLIEGGKIVICGPAHLSVLKSGNTVTLAVDSGTVHAYVNHGPALTIYTAQIQAQPVAIGSGLQDALVGFDTPTSMCVRAKNGAIRLEQQLTGQSLVVPQNGDILLLNGQLEGVRSGAGHCACELEEVKLAQPRMADQVGLVASTKDSKPSAESSKPAAPPVAVTPSPDQPEYHVYMPPLRYDASAKIQDAPDPALIVLVRHVRVRPTLIFESTVEGDPVVAENVAPPQPAPKPASPQSAKPPAQHHDSMVTRVKTFFYRLWTGR
jgi:hypothetical protein